MRNQNEKYRNALKFLGKVTVDTLPDILNFIPTIGIPLGTGAKILIGGINEKEEISKEAEMNRQIREIQDAIDRNLTNAEEIAKTIQSHIMDQIEKKPVYMFGMIAYSMNGEIIEEDIQEEIRKVFSGEYEYKGEYAVLSEEICEFIIKYYGGESIREKEDFYFVKDKLVMNFWTDHGECYIRDEQAVLDFIDTLNNFLEQKVFSEFSIF